MLTVQNRISVLTSYAATQHQAFSTFLVDFTIEMRDDAKWRRKALVALEESPEIFAAVQKTLTAPPATTVENLSPLAESLVALLTAMETNDADEVITLLHAEMAHRKKWDEVLERYPETLELLRRSIEGAGEDHEEV